MIEGVWCRQNKVRSLFCYLLSSEGRLFPDRVSQASGVIPLGVVGPLGYHVPLAFFVRLEALFGVVCLARHHIWLWHCNWPGGGHILAREASQWLNMS